MSIFNKFLHIVSSVAISIMAVTSMCVSAVEIDNDGDYRDNVFGKSDIPSSFTGVEYYDFYVPYKYTAGEIGGYSTGGTATMTPSLQKRVPGAFVNKEGDMFNWSPNYWRKWGVEQCGNTGVKQGYESSTGLATLIDKNGTTYYITAFPWVLFREQNYFGSPSAWGIFYNTGQVFDVILTDGTVIHFVMGDAKAEVHTNGGKAGGYNPDSQEYTSFEKANLSKHPQYTNMFQAVGGEILEVWGKGSCSANFMNKYGLKETGGEGSNHIAIIRVYDTMVGEAPTPASDEIKEVSYSLGNVKITGGSGGSKGNTLNMDGVGLAGSLYAEDYFGVGLNYLDEHSIALPTAEMLTISDRFQLTQWKNNVEYMNADSKHGFLRGGLMFVGIMIIVYSTLLFMAFQFDKINNFIEIEVLGKLTFGKLLTARDDISTYATDEKSKPKLVVQKDIIIVTLSGIAIGVLILTGKLYAILAVIIKYATLWI